MSRSDVQPGLVVRRKRAVERAAGWLGGAGAAGSDCGRYRGPTRARFETHARGHRNLPLAAPQRGRGGGYLLGVHGSVPPGTAPSRSSRDPADRQPRWRCGHRHVVCGGRSRTGRNAPSHEEAPARHVPDRAVAWRSRRPVRLNPIEPLRFGGVCRVALRRVGHTYAAARRSISKRHRLGQPEQPAPCRDVGGLFG